MNGAPFHVLVETIVYLAICITALGCLGFAIWKVAREHDRTNLPTWRRIVGGIGFVAVTFQAILFITSWTRIGKDYVQFSQWSRLVLPSFLVAVPCVLADRGAIRWYLLSSSILLFVICFFIVLSA